ncbi:uncharacterized protein HMPREF1541_01274 [Cyphellophora europaea CBS 101466]|uniref:Carboxylic ester hydrolase n=1 Tax=Cyphellophora europaea (strain CBS 101466) TaxID=1220924 RepID=W2SGS4_CYPE1|nr:uncharacterized protein HMPREF1541_01274 [Cyphellophora europaea CBS 101466]ETN47084.1 hypothetical protein HMPREF1541_01274 [Cyphellophora europaea CBS 101466]
MSVPSLAVVLLVAAVASAYPGSSHAVCNSQSSLTLIYQNNLNASDDSNHVSAIILDPMPARNAQTACGAINESLLTQATIQNYTTDFTDTLAYLDYTYGTGPAYLVDNAVVTLQDQSLSYAASNSAQRNLPVLCTQSDRETQPPNSTASASNLVTVAAAGNTYIGYHNQKSFRFAGIRYANTPERFEYSKVYSGTGETINATAYGSQCLQGGGGSEDCLFLNIQTPYIPKAGSSNNLRPVYFWIHGGGFTGGTGADPGTDGGNLASREDIVVVTINYRLSTLGFLAIPDSPIKGNYGIGDQINALKWTVANIAKFGGDPKRITIAGSSAGAGSVRTLLGSPPAIGLFQGAQADSNLGGGVDLGLDGNYGTTYSSYLTINESYTRGGFPVLNATNCTSGSTTQQIACLRTANATTLISGNDIPRYVVQDGTIVTTPKLDVTARNGTSAYVPIMFGVAANDGASFSTLSPTPVANLSEGLQTGLSINASAADAIIASGLFPFYSSGNLTLDAFNVTQRVATDNTFRCIDQATVYAGAVTHTFPATYYYQFERSIDGYNPNNLSPELIQGPRSPNYPNGNPHAPYFKLHGSTGDWIFGNFYGRPLRDETDLWSLQLTSGYFAEFVRSGQPNMREEALRVRGAAYAKTLEAVRTQGSWGAVQGEAGPVRFLDWPARSGGFVDVEQCRWLNYSLSYYVDGGS